MVIYSKLDRGAVALLNADKCQSRLFTGRRTTYPENHLKRKKFSTLELFLKVLDVCHDVYPEKLDGESE